MQPAPTDVVPLFATTEDRVNKVGVPLAATIEGQTPAAQQGAIGFAFKDANGNVILPQLNSRGQILVASDTAPGQRFRSHGRVPGITLVAPGTGDYTGWQNILAINAVASSGYGEIAARVACRRDAIAELIYQDAGGSVIILDTAIMGPGQYTVNLGLGPDEDSFTVPASASTPQFIVRGGQFPGTPAGANSDLHGTLALTAF